MSPSAPSSCAHDAGGLTVQYRGWSSIEVRTPEGRRLLFDANLTPFDGETLSTEADHDGADLLFISHGHFDHCQDAPRLARRTGARVVASTPLARFVRDRGPVPPDRLLAMDGEATNQLDELTFHSHPWVHRTLLDRWPAMLARRPGGVLKMRRALACFLSSPLTGFRVGVEGRWWVSCIGEAFHGQTDAALVERVRAAGEPGVALVALEPGLEDEVARWVALLRPPVVLTYGAHDVMWRYFGLPPVDPERFARALAARDPQIRTRHLTVGQTVAPLQREDG